MTPTSTKRKREDNLEVNSLDTLRELLSSAITNHVSAEVALLHIIEEHNFSPSLLQEVLTKDSFNVSFSKVQYVHIAPFVGLNPDRNLYDIATFDLYRSRIPTSLFRSIVQDMDLLLHQYGPPVDHRTEEATSRFLAPVFNHLVAQFGFAFRNLPESIIEGRITTKGRIEHYFKAFGSVGLLFIEVKLKIPGAEERLNAVAQVIAECDACSWNNTQKGLRVPVFGILCDGETFQFFSFDGSSKPFSFRRGFLEDPPVFRQIFKLDDFIATQSSEPFILNLRQICEITFDLLLQSYVSSLEAYRNRSATQGEREGKPRKSLQEWEEALRLAYAALGRVRAAEKMRQDDLPDEANTIAEDAMDILKRSTDKVPDIDKINLIMSGWDDKKVETM